jgi:hypothetical protein
MINEIKIFLFVLSCLFVTKLLLEFIIKIFQPVTEPMKLGDVEKVSLYLSVSYIITFIIT